MLHLAADPLPPAITTALYFLIFGRLIGGRIGTVNGATYIDYSVPGIRMMSVISHSYANVVSSFYSTKFQRHIGASGRASAQLGDFGRLCIRRHRQGAFGGRRGCCWAEKNCPP